MDINSQATLIITTIAVVVISMTLHEIAHAYSAYFLGDQTPKAQGRLSLNPIKHLDPFMSVLVPLLLAISGGPIFGGAKPVQINPHKLRWNEWGMAIVAIAGPATNFFLAFTAFGIFHFAHPHISDFANFAIIQFIFINLGFCVFNLLPIPPLDGSRVLYAFAPDFIRRGMDTMERFGIFVVMALVMVFGAFLFQIMRAAIGAIFDFFLWIVA